MKDSRRARPGLGTMLRHLIELMDGDVEMTYREAGLDYKPRYTPVMRALARGPKAIRDIANSARITHSAASQTVAQMTAHGLVSIGPGADRRERAARLTRGGRGLLKRLEPHWDAVAAAARTLEAELGQPLSDIVESAIVALERTPFRARIAAAQTRRRRAAI